MIFNFNYKSYNIFFNINVFFKKKKPLFSFPTPYIYTNISVLTLLEASFSPSDLFPAILSISSINIIAGVFSLAI